MAARIRWWLEGEPTPALEALRADLDAILEGPRSEGRPRVGRKRFYRVEPENPGDPVFFVKIFTAPPGLARLTSWFRRSRAPREAATARAIAAKGFAVAAPVASGEERRAGLLVRGISITVGLPLRDLRSLLEDPATSRAQVRALVTSFGGLNRRMHEAGIDQDDTSPNNFLVDAALEWTLIDFERCKLGRPLSEGRRTTLLAKLQRHDLGVSRTDRLRLLRAYLTDGDERSARRAAWRRIEPELLNLRRRDARRAIKGAFEVGRHVGQQGRTWYIKGREDAAVVRLSLDAAQCRAVWTLAHVFERLALPALRPVRLDDDAVELLAPELDEHAMEFHTAVARARKRFDPYGTWVREPQWALTPAGAVLLTPSAFKLRL
jgi:hypothetical protein